MTTDEKDLELAMKLAPYDIVERKQKKSHQQKLFWSVLCFSIILMIIALVLAARELKGTPTTQEVAILGLIITAPIVMVLALLRYVYDGKKSDAPQPTLLLNVGKELAGVIQGIFKK